MSYFLLLIPIGCFLLLLVGFRLLGVKLDFGQSIAVLMLYLIGCAFSTIIQ